MKSRKPNKHPRPDLEPLSTIVPGHESIKLVSYYPQFRTYYPTCELQTKRWLVENVESKWIAIDAGANIGYHSVLLATLASSGQVYAFEPTSTSSMLRQNLMVNGVHNVEVLEMALGREEGRRTDSIYRIWGQSAEEAEYRFTTIDSFVEERKLERLDFLKIDVDGFDLEVLQGSKRTLGRYSPVVLVEVNHALATRGFTASDVHEFMLANRYGRALILDKDNYVYFKDWQLGEPWPSRLEFSFDERRVDPVGDFEIKWDEAVDTEIPMSIANQAVTTDFKSYTSSDPAWFYVVTGELADVLGNEALGIRVELVEGSLGVFVSDSSASTLATSEVIVNRPGLVATYFVLPDLPSAKIVFRKTTNDPLTFRIISLQTGPIQVRTKKDFKLSEVTAPELSRITGHPATESWCEQPLAAVDAISIDDLLNQLGDESHVEVMVPRRLHDSRDHLMERDDAPVLAALFQALKPSRHLEFGTWEGFGATLCARNCDAEIWTVNLPFGEKADDIAAYTMSREPFHPANPGLKDVSDQGAMVGWMYRSAGFSSRVNQVLADSTQVKLSDLGDQQFDSILIDGGHDRNVVRADQRNALELVTDSGVIIWHDFTLDPDLLRDQPASRGVVAAVADDLAFLTRLRMHYWIKGTMILISLPKTPATPHTE